MSCSVRRCLSKSNVSKAICFALSHLHLSHRPSEGYVAIYSSYLLEVHFLLPLPPLVIAFLDFTDFGIRKDLFFDGYPCYRDLDEAFPPTNEEQILCELQRPWCASLRGTWRSLSDFSSIYPEVSSFDNISDEEYANYCHLTRLIPHGGEHSRHI